MNIVVLIPAYKPEKRLVGYVDELASSGFGRIVVVDDGSGGGFKDIFDELESMPFCSVLRHPSNRGKGVALKTGLSHILEFHQDALGVLTADADGQHVCEDCIKVAQSVVEGDGAAVIGSRNFRFGRIPLRSWIGNRWSSLSLAIVLGRWIPDTQTGLRAFPMSILPMLIQVGGQRYEYEMGVLMAMVRKGIPVATVPIRTIYEDGNASSHFSPLKDTIRINRLVLADFFRFAGVSIASFVLDQGLAWGFAAALHMVGADVNGGIWLSGIAARIVSSVFNFSLNRTFVFKSGGRIGTTAWKYALLCLLVIVASNAGVTALVAAGMPRGAAKLICDILLYLVGYNVQSRFIFNGR